MHKVYAHIASKNFHGCIHAEPAFLQHLFSVFATKHSIMTIFIMH